MCTAHTTSYKCNLCSTKTATTLTTLKECGAYLSALQRNQVPTREALLRDRMAAALTAPVHLIGAHSFWAWSWTGRDEAFTLYPRRTCLEVRHVNLDWVCDACEMPEGKEWDVWRIVRDGLRGREGEGEECDGVDGWKRV